MKETLEDLLDKGELRGDKAGELIASTVAHTGTNINISAIGVA